MVDNLDAFKQSSKHVPDDMNDRRDVRAPTARPPTPAKLPAWAAVIGLTCALLILVGLYMAGNAAWSAVAGEPRDDASPGWLGIAYGAGSLTSALALSRPGIMRIPRRLRQIELPVNLQAMVFMLLAILQFVFGMMLPLP